MKKFKNKRLLISILLSLISIYILFYQTIPLIRNYYKLSKHYIYKKNTLKLLMLNLNKENKIKPVEFAVGRRRFSTDIMSVLSYIRYLRKCGFNIKINIFKPKNLKNNNNAYLKIKNFNIMLSDFSDVNVLFSLLKTEQSFPFEIKNINIESGRKINAAISAELIGFKKSYFINYK